MRQKVRKRTALRNAEYYDQQELFDSLYSRSKNNEVFGHLMDDITNPENIKLAYRNIKRNNGSETAGTDGMTIAYFSNMGEKQFVEFIQKRFANYHPKAVRRVEIPKPNGKMRPLGIPCMTDRIIQQCVLQVLEPICEAKFYEHSYGFRPNRSAENAVAYLENRMFIGNLYYVVDVDIKGFFDNVNHKKLLRQLWTLGIRDTKLLQIIKAMLKAPIRLPDGMTVFPEKGTPQGGILSPLLANVVLNELDWWVASQWELFSDHMKRYYKPKFNAKGVRDLSYEYSVMRKTNLKEMHIVRYADDFKIICATRTDAERVMTAVKDWLRTRLKLEVSEEKSKVTNVKRHYSEFLGFKIKVRKKAGKWVDQVHMCDKEVNNAEKKIREAVRFIQDSGTDKEQFQRIAAYNSLVIGLHNYYRMPNVHSVNVVHKAYYYYCENDQSLTHVYKPDRFEKLVAFQLHLEELCASDVYSDEVRYRIKRPFLDNLLACMKSEVNCVKEIGAKEIHRSISKMCTNEMVQKIVWMVPDVSFSRARRMIHFCIRHKMSFSTIVLIRAQQYLWR